MAALHHRISAVVGATLVALFCSNHERTTPALTPRRLGFGLA